MLSKRFYDILALIFIILMIGSQLIIPIILDSPRGLVEGKSPEEFSNAFYLSFAISTLSTLVLIGIYAIFIIILTIQMKSRGLVSLPDTIFIVLFFPLDIVFYFVTLRKHFKEIDNVPLTQETPVQKTPTQTTPSTVVAQ